MKLAWATDVHFNFLEREEVVAWCRDEVLARDPDALLLSGDLAEAPDLEDWLRLLEEELQRPIHFVLGNHDFYRGSIAAVRARVQALSARSRFLTWLGGADVVSLTDETALVGHDGWGDARFGDHASSSIALNDFRLIEELAFLDKDVLGERLNALGDEAAAHVRRVLPNALETHRRVIFLTHVPPVLEACTWKGEIANDEWAPYFTCKAVGEALIEIMAAHPDRSLTALCGHTHSEVEVEVAKNLVVRVGHAEYHAPKVNALIEA